MVMLGFLIDRNRRYRGSVRFLKWIFCFRVILFLNFLLYFVYLARMYASIEGAWDMARALSLSFFFNKANFLVISPILSVFVLAKLSDWEGSFKGSFLVSTLVGSFAASGLSLSAISLNSIVFWAMKLLYRLVSNSGSYLEANLLQTSLSFILLFLLKYQIKITKPIHLQMSFIQPIFWSSKLWN